MDTQQLFVGVVLVLVGGLQAVRPDIMMRFQIWTQRVIMRAEYVPSARTYTIVRFVGAFIMVLGLFVLAGAPRTLTDEQVFCTADAMQCPDGSYVGRTGPNCEFRCP